MISGPRHFAALAGRLRWDPEELDLSADALLWGAIDVARRRRLRALIAGFCVAECRVADELEPFVAAAPDSTIASVFTAQRADERRHAVLFDRIAAEVLGLEGPDAEARREAVRALAPPAVVELFEVQLPETAAALAVGRTGLGAGVGLYHLVLEGVVLSAGQRALLDDLSDQALPGVRRGVELVERDERWHVGFGLRCLLETGFASAEVPALVRAGEVAMHAWGFAVPADVRARVGAQHRRRLTAIDVGAARPRDHRAADFVG